MIVGLYIIGSAFMICLLASKLREARHQLQKAAWERDAYARTIQAPRPAPSYADITTAPEGRALPPAGTLAAYPDRRPGQ